MRFSFAISRARTDPEIPWAAVAAHAHENVLLIEAGCLEDVNCRALALFPRAVMMSRSTSSSLAEDRGPP